MSAFLTFSAARRVGDKWGSGAYGASRGGRKHRGIDFLSLPGQVLLSPIAGRVTKIGWPYSQSEKRHFRYVEVTDVSRLRHRFFYVDAKDFAVKGDVVTVGDLLGAVQNIASLHEGMGNHVHYEIMRVANGKREYLNPDEFLEG